MTFFQSVRLVIIGSRGGRILDPDWFEHECQRSFPALSSIVLMSDAGKRAKPVKKVMNDPLRRAFFMGASVFGTCARPL